ncbi:hypothetical protein LRS05_10705 [Flavobacterium sp. J372]|uniref:hypothetical protein n=1 Tax=Flavobacterium sp. J372 TaxID=2898436 RepID=UPI002150FBAF|nr:hypothetical protein [Flavobacterium sp. J372]MCR5862590.1 hypothetical protein [Flavobacterium sp. J372]
MMKNFLRKANSHKRSLLGALTKSLGSEVEAAPPGLDAATIERILVVRPNHRLGNTLMLTPLVREINHLLPGATVDLFVKGIPPERFSGIMRMSARLSHSPKSISADCTCIRIAGCSCD